MLRIGLFFTVFLSMAIAPAMAADPSFQKAIQPVLKQYCFDCHGSQKQKSQVRFDRIEGYRAEDVTLWTQVHEMVAAGEMPPKEHAQPSDAERKQLLAWIESEARAAKEALGTGSTRRLNRREFAAALRDLTGLSIDYASAMPGDGTVDGFDTGAEGLQDAADSVALWMQIARRAVDGIRFIEPATSQSFKVDLRTAGKDLRKAFDAWKEHGGSGKPSGFYKQDVGVYLDPKWVGERGGSSFYVPAPADKRGIVRVRLLVSVHKNMPQLPNPHLWVEVAGRDIDYREITASADQPVELIYEVQLDDLAIGSKGVEVTISNRIEVPYAIEGFENEDKSRPGEPIPGGPGLFRPAYDKKKTPIDEQPVPFVVLHEIEIERGYVAAWPPAAWKASAGTIEDSLASATRLLTLWMDRAYRRPTSEAERARFIELYKRLRASDMSFDESLRATFQSVLLSGGFRYLPSPADPDRTVAQHAIASRLSFMLWGAPPDDELLGLAAAGKLREPSVLNAQVDRLLTDPRSDAFFRPFVTQWLVLDQPITIAMDSIQKQDFRFGRNLKASMREETIQYITQLFRENRPASELVVSDWTLMNEILAHHYGYDGIRGAELRKVKLKATDPRGGGILGHAGIQSMLCWMGENWVIYRGAWVLRHILDDPPPPPPLEVPELIPSDGGNRGKTFRELLVQHQKDENCSVCHRKMDPLGFAFQNFDLSGRWRDVEYDTYARNELDGKIEWRGVGKTRPVDTAGQLPGGKKFNSFAQCKQSIVSDHLPDVVRGIMKNLMLFAAGRKPDVEDMAEIRAAIKERAANRYPLADMLKAVVKSKAFLDH